jgi:fatty acid desaturase
MDYPKKPSKSVYDYTDKSVEHAGYAAIAYAAINLFSGVLAWVQYFLYHRAGTGGVLNRDFSSQQYLQHTPLITAVAVAFSIILAAVSGVLAFLIFRQSRFAVAAMLVLVAVLQLYTWFVAHSPAGTLVSIVVIGFLLRGARRIFQDHAEQKIEAEKAGSIGGANPGPL